MAKREAGLDVVRQERFRDRDALQFFMVRRGAAVDIVALAGVETTRQGCLGRRRQPAQRGRSSLALKIRRLARNSKFGDDGAVTIVGQFIPKRFVNVDGAP